jgi:hypothetical protein
MRAVQWFHPEVNGVQTFLALELNAGACLFDQYLADALYFLDALSFLKLEVSSMIVTVIPFASFLG